MHQKINYKGLTRLPSDVSSFDGEMEDVYNLFNVNGELRPYVPPEQIGTLSGVLMFVHKNQGREHFITLDGSELKAYEYNNSFTSIGTVTNIYGEELLKIDSVGNTLIILTNKEVKYALWKDSSYKYLGSKIPFPNITLKVNGQWHEYESINLSRYSSVLDTLFVNRDPSDKMLEHEYLNEFWGYINKNHADTVSDGYLSFPFMARYAVRMYDGSLVNHSMPFFIRVNTKDFNWNIDTHLSDSYILREAINRGKLVASWGASYISNWSDIISSVDIFISSPIYTYNDSSPLFYHAVTAGMQSPLPAGKRILPLMTNAPHVAIPNTGNFYLAQSISIDKLSSSGNLTIDTTDIENISTKERMTDDYLSHDSVIADNSFSYNNKLHLTGIKRTMFPGFKLGGMTTYYDGATATASIDVGSQAFLFYPGRCSSVILSNQVGSSHKEIELPLIPHPTLNGSYYLHHSLDPISNNGQVGSTAIPAKIEFAKQKPYNEADYNKIYVSEINNPFLFPVNSRVTLPVGQIIAVSSNTKAISSGQFGQFPLYAFTDDGIWALEVSSDGKYLARQPVSREVAINANILQMDNYIAFISKRGLNILSGSSTECISEIVREMNNRSSKVSITSFIQGVEAEDLQQVYNTSPIEEYMKDCDLAYEYINGNGRIYMINNKFNYCYVFDILSKSWSKVQGNYRNSISNYPDSYVQSTNGAVFNLASLREFTDTLKVFFMSRPIRQEQALFTLRQLAHNGLFSSLATCIYGSRDGVNYIPVSSGTNRLLRIGGSPYRYYKISIIGDLNSHEVISSIEIMLETRFTNRLR